MQPEQADIDPIDLVATCDLSPVRKPANKLRSWFLSPAVSLVWVQRAAKLPGKSLHLATALLHLSQLYKSSEVQVQPSMLQRFGVTRKVGYRCLDLLVDAGLVAIVDRASGRAATVLLIGVAELDAGR